jgi:predicted nucleic acid-binding protein
MDGSELHVPSLWVWEILNVVGVTIRRRRITGDRGREFLTLLAKLNVKIDRPPQVTDFPRLHALANSRELTAYDAAYLDLAKRLSLPLATCDAGFRKAALAEGLAVL